jgi:hypothetical protein
MSMRRFLQEALDDLADRGGLCAAASDRRKRTGSTGLRKGKHLVEGCLVGDEAALTERAAGL